MSTRARAVLAQKSKSFALAGKLLPRAARDDAAVLYAYCRRVDDAIDEAPEGEAAARVEALGAELSSIYAGVEPSDPLLAEFARLVERRGIPECYPRALLEGMKSDVGRVRLASVDDLLLYAYRVAGVVGVMMCYVTGLSDRRALSNAVHLGIAMQLTNVCRDVEEDWARGRLYVPHELLRAAGAPELGADFSLPLAAQRRPLACAVKELLRLADRYYASGDAGLFALPARASLAVRAARRVYAAIGRELERRGYDVLAGRAVVSGWKKAALVARAAFEELVLRSAALLGARPAPRLGGRAPETEGTHGHLLTLDS